MSKIIASAAIRGAHKIWKKAEDGLSKAVRAKGKDAPVAFPDTAYYLPFTLAMYGLQVQKLSDLETALAEAKKLLPEVPSEKLWLPYLGAALDAGIATLVAEEVIEVLKYQDGGRPENGLWLGFTDDSILRTQGIKLVDGRMPGFAACVGAMPDSKSAVKLIRELQERNILVFIAGNTKGVSIAEQLAQEGVEMGWDNYIVPYGKNIESAIYALNFAARSAMTFGGLKPGGLKEARDILLYNKNRVFAFVLALGEVDDEKYATAAGAINFGFPVIADTDIPAILPTGICTYEHVVPKIPRDQMVEKAVEVRGLKIKIEKIDIPVRYGPAFEGERVRKEDLAAEFGGKTSKTFEYVRMRDLSDVEDGKIVVDGPEMDAAVRGEKLPLGIVVEVAGRKMQKDFESILERRIHLFLSEVMGLMHMGQRDIAWLRFNHDVVKAGFKVTHLGTVLHAKLKSDYPAIVDKVQITLITDQKKFEAMLPQALAAYRERDHRIGSMTDESVDIFYTCTLCQSYAPNHICIITPERLGLCGSYNWLDGKANFEIDPTGVNQPVKKGEVLDPVRGQWKNINDVVFQKSNGTLQRFNAYSLMAEPMTSCGCFECIVAIVPEANGVMVVPRGHSGMTPCGMTFSTLAGTIGGGVQTPGFLGVGKVYLTSGKFISAEGGLPRIVWMTKELKTEMREALDVRAKALGMPDFVDKIADETVGDNTEAILPFLQEKSHPALSMDPLI